MKNKNSTNEIERLQKVVQYMKTEKESVRVFKEKNRELKLLLHRYQMREIMIIWGIIWCITIFVVVFTDFEGD